MKICNYLRACSVSFPRAQSASFLSFTLNSFQRKNYMSVYVYTCHMSITEVAFSDLSLVETGDKQHFLIGELIPMTMVAHMSLGFQIQHIHIFF